MNTNIRRTLLAAFALLLFVSSAFAGDPIPGIDVKLGRNPGGSMIETTSNNGQVTFTGLTPGERCTISFDNEQVQKMAIKEQGLPKSKGKSVTITLTITHAGSVALDGTVIDQRDDIDILAAKSIVVTADDKGQVRATVNSSRSNIKK